MKIIQYVKAFGNKKFSELPFNEVDALIFAELAYVNFDLAIGEYEFKKLKNLKIENKKKFYEGSVDSFFNRELVELMIKSVRYRNVKIGFCRQMVDRKKALQFFAMTLIMPDHRGYIAYRGTDTSLNGWKEDMLLAFQNHMPGQEKAVEYIKQIVDADYFDYKIDMLQYMEKYDDALEAIISDKNKDAEKMKQLVDEIIIKRPDLKKRVEDLCLQYKVNL